MGMSGDGDADAQDRARKQWDADAAMEALALEGKTLSLSEEAVAAKLLREGLPLAVASVVHIAQFGETEKMRFDASRYVIDRNLGSITREGDIVNQALDPMDELLQECTDYVNANPSK